MVAHCARGLPAPVRRGDDRARAARQRSGARRTGGLSFDRRDGDRRAAASAWWASLDPSIASRLRLLTLDPGHPADRCCRPLLRPRTDHDAGGVCQRLHAGGVGSHEVGRQRIARPRDYNPRAHIMRNDVAIEQASPTDDVSTRTGSDHNSIGSIAEIHNSVQLRTDPIARDGVAAAIELESNVKAVDDQAFYDRVSSLNRQASGVVAGK